MGHPDAVSRPFVYALSLVYERGRPGKNGRSRPNSEEEVLYWLAQAREHFLKMDGDEREAAELFAAELGVKL